MLKFDQSQRVFNNSWFNTLLSSDAAGDLAPDLATAGEGSADGSVAASDQIELATSADAAGFQLDLATSVTLVDEALLDPSSVAHHGGEDGPIGLDVLIDGAAEGSAQAGSLGTPAAGGTSPDILFGQAGSLAFAPSVTIPDDTALGFDSAAFSPAESQGGPAHGFDGNGVDGIAAQSDGPAAFDGMGDVHGAAFSVVPDPSGTPTVHKTTAEAAQQITRDNYDWGTSIGVAVGPISFGFRTSQPGYPVNGRDVQGTFSAFTAAEETAARAALQLWADAAHITFTDLGDTNNATIEFANYSSSTDNSEAFAFNPINNDQSAGGYEGDVFINTFYASTSNDDPGTYEFETFIHEIGHALGLEHPGNYNAGPGQTITYDNNAEYVEDSRQYTLMSYFSETNTGASFAVNNEAPMMHDIAAIQRLYGANYDTRTGNTTYGFNSNAGSPYLIGSATQHVAWAIWDGGGTDTVDVSGYSQNATINLGAETFSSVGGDVENVSIAAGVTIENAIGGSGNDRIDGNNVANLLEGNDGNDNLFGYDGADHLYGDNGNDTLKGGGGADSLDGGSGINTADYDTFLGGAGSNVDLANHTVTGGDGQGDQIYSIQNLLGSSYGDTFYGTSEANNFSGAGGDDFMDGYLGDDTLDGGSGTNTLSYARDLGVTVDLSRTDAQATGGSGSETISNFINLYGSYYNDVLTGDVNGNYIYGEAGQDILIGGGGNDTLQAGNPFAYLVKASTTQNTTQATAISLDGLFNTTYVEFIQNSITTPHATVTATANGGDEYYSFTVTAGATAHFDIDQTFLGTDTYLKIYDSTGTQVTYADDTSGGVIDPGSQSLLDTGFDYTFANAGTYYVDVLKFPSGGDLLAGTQYTLNVSLTGATVVANTAGSVLLGGDGDDTLFGGSGSDTASYGDAMSGVTVSLNADGTAQNTGGAGTDTIYNIENLIGSQSSDQLTGSAGANVINGRGGVDFMTGLGGNDTYYVDTAGDLVFEAAGGGSDGVYSTVNYALAAGQEIETLATTNAAGTTAINLTGNDFANTIYGNAGANVINGGTQADKMIGYGGNDTYYVDNAADQVVEAAGGGSDLVWTSVSYTLTAGQEIEKLYALAPNGMAAINLTGNAFANTLAGTAGANVLNGAGGADTMIGLGGNDTYYVDNAADQVVEATGGGTDTVRASVTYVLAAGQEVEFLTTTNSAGTDAINLTGNNLANTIYGNAAANLLDGSGGLDTLAGLGGNDIYYVDNAGDQVIEAVGGGADIVRAGVNYTLASGQEIESLTTTNNAGTGAINLTGNNYANTIYGNAGVNVIDGGTGADTLAGLGGNDTYFVDNVGDKVFETVGGGSDIVRAGVSYTLLGGQEIEFLTTTNNAGTTAINLTGNAFANTIYGNAGANALDGGAGADTMAGLGGNDTYYVDNAADQVIEAAGGGADVVRASVSYALSAGQEIESLTTTNNAGTSAISLSGNGGANAIYGNAGANALDGGLGADTLVGFAGHDTFVFSTALGAGNIDHVFDFAPSAMADHDTIQLAHSIFTVLPLGALATAAFVDLAAGPETTSSRVLYNHNTGALSYDSDGTGGAAAVQFAILDNHAVLTHSDFFIG